MYFATFLTLIFTVNSFPWGSILLDAEKIEAFKKRYKKFMVNRQGVTDVEFFGSTKESFRWISGKSDLDIIVYGWNISSKTKIEGILFIEKLNYLLHLKLENVLVGHPTPIYIDSPQRYFLISFIGFSRFITDPARFLIKRNFNEKIYPFTYRSLWNYIKKLNNNESFFIPFPVAKFL